MSFWNEIHWYEGVFLRPHHLQAAHRHGESHLRAALEAALPHAWGFADLQIAREPLENFTLRVDRCELRLKDGTLVRIPENADPPPINVEAALLAGGGSANVYVGVPHLQDVRANAIPLENPTRVPGNPRFEPRAITRRDENTGENPQTLYVRWLRARLFVDGDDMTGFEVVRLCRVRRTDRPGAVPELDELGAGPLLAIQADGGLSSLLTSLADQVEAKDEVLAREAREHRMLFTDGVAANTEHLLKLHELNESRAELRALLQSPRLHPFDAFVVLSRLVGRLSVFHDELVPGPLPIYEHDEPGASFDRLRRRLLVLLDAMRPLAYVERPFIKTKDERNRDGLEVELDRSWIDQNLDMYVGLEAPDKEINELHQHVYSRLNMKLASPKRCPRIHNIAVRGLRLEIRPVPAGTLPRRQGLHYFKVDKTIGPDREDYWKECEQERGIRMSIADGQIGTMEQLRPRLFVAMKGPGR